MYDSKSIKQHYLLKLGHQANAIAVSVFMISTLRKVAERYSDVLTVYGMGDLFGNHVGQMEEYKKQIEFIEKNSKITHKKFDELTINLQGQVNTSHRDFDIGVCVDDEVEENFILGFSKELENEYEKLIGRLDENGLVNGYLKDGKSFNGFDYKDKGSWKRNYIMSILSGEITNISRPLKDLFFEGNGCLLYQDDDELANAHEQFGMNDSCDSIKLFEKYLLEFVTVYKNHKNEHENFGIYFNFAKKALEEIESLKQEIS